MSANENGMLPPPDDDRTPTEWPLPVEAVHKKHFDAFETRFFQQGDDGSTLPGAEVFYEGEGSRLSGGPRVSRATLAALTATSTLIAIFACLALRESTAPAPTVALPVVKAPSRLAVTPPPPAPAVTTASAAAPAAATPEPTLAPVAAAPAIAAEATAPAIAAEATAPAPSLPAPAAAAPVAGEPMAASAAAAAPVAGEETPPANPESPAVAAALPADGEARERCVRAIHGKRNRDVLAVCPAVFAAAADAETAVALAKAELDRGHFTQASAWSKKAIAIDPAAAEAYVYAGGADQNQGHRQAAKTAYLNYLRLAPSGRYAAEIRTIVSSL